MSIVPPLRIRALNQAPVRRDAQYVLYWMTSSRRLEWSFALDRALEHARELRLPLVVLEALRAAVVVTDDFPTFFLRRMQAAVAPRLTVALEAVDGNGLLPLAATPGPFSAAIHFRRFLQRSLGEHLLHLPCPEPLTEAGTRESAFPADIATRWPAASDALLELEPSALAELPVDAQVGPTGLSLTMPLAGHPGG